MVLFPVRPEKQKELRERMDLLGIREEDLEEQYVRASGRGGQKLHKTSSCVALVHKPTGVSVKCQQSRSQTMNRFLARRLLADKIEEMSSKGSEARMSSEEKIRKQKLRRRRRARKKPKEEEDLAS